MPDPALLITCEHAVNHVPSQWRHLFKGQEEILQSHRAYDPGALEMARTLALSSSAPLYTAQVTRLLVDHNRSPHHPKLWSEFSRSLPADQKHRLLAEYYRPYREAASRWIQSQSKVVVHVSVHSFTPVLNGQVRRADIGILYDPHRALEAQLGRAWKGRLEILAPDLRTRLNTPYRGSSDCHQSSYRTRFESAAYLGIELEINQGLVAGRGSWRQLQELVAGSLQDVLVTVRDMLPGMGCHALA